MSDDETHNEILAAAKEAKANKARAPKADAKKGNNWTLGAIGLGVGIGSAAVAAALLYTNRDKPKD